MKKFSCGALVTVILLLLVGGGYLAFNEQGRDVLGRVCTGVGSFFVGIMFAMTFVAAVLLLRLNWRLDSAGSRQPNIIIHGAPAQPPGLPRPDHTLPPSHWPRSSRQYNLLGSEDIQDGEYRNVNDA